MELKRLNPLLVLHDLRAVTDPYVVVVLNTSGPQSEMQVVSRETTEADALSTLDELVAAGEGVAVIPPVMPIGVKN